jgi:hypothetical protein
MKELKAYVIDSTDIVEGALVAYNSLTFNHIKHSSLTSEMIEKASLIIYKSESGQTKVLKNIFAGVL